MATALVPGDSQSLLPRAYQPVACEGCSLSLRETHGRALKQRAPDCDLSSHDLAHVHGVRDVPPERMLEARRVWGLRRLQLQRRSRLRGWRRKRTHVATDKPFVESLSDLSAMTGLETRSGQQVVRQLDPNWQISLADAGGVSRRSPGPASRPTSGAKTPSDRGASLRRGPPRASGEPGTRAEDVEERAQPCARAPRETRAWNSDHDASVGHVQIHPEGDDFEVLACGQSCSEIVGEMRTRQARELSAGSP
jgi:hypothetical protein